MKRNSWLNSVMSFEAFIEIYKFINQKLNQNSYHLSDVHYYGLGKFEPAVHYSHFRTKASIEEVKALKEEAIVVEPFGEAKDTTGKTEYVVVIVNMHYVHDKNGFIFQERGHMGRYTDNRTQVDVEIKEMTNVILLLPMNISSNEHKTFQTKYSFDGLIYDKNCRIFFPYYAWSDVIDDNRD